MNRIIDKIKFEYVFAFVIVVVISVALFVFKENNDVVNQLIVALIGALSSITAYFFTKHNPNK
ncbi:hypothetical protein [Cytobacillus kochii]|uniref:hypothetical protein n=1 Tax=Cytobacillus kochii TaxID=859143 RepID=UPI00247FD8F0|nr:hypothetical protein [Cytobacillus kochii]